MNNYLFYLLLFIVIVLNTYCIYIVNKYCYIIISYFKDIGNKINISDIPDEEFVYFDFDLTKKEKYYRLKKIVELFKDNQINSKMGKYITELNLIDDICTVKSGINDVNECYAYVFIRTSYSFEELWKRINYVIFNDETSCNVRLFRQNSVPVYCFMFAHDNWECSLKALIKCFKK